MFYPLVVYVFFQDELCILGGKVLGTKTDIFSTRRKMREMKKWDHDRSNLSVFRYEENFRGTNLRKTFDGKSF